jgi:K+-sensing histidine kinase KdpD
MFAQVAAPGEMRTPNRAGPRDWRNVLGRRALAIHACALAGVAAATLLTALADQVAEGRYAVFLFFSAVVFVSASMSLSTGLLATAASTWAAFFFFFSPERTWTVTAESGVLCALFFVMNTAITVATWRAQRALSARLASAHVEESSDALEWNTAVLGMVSHELRNRLTAVSMSADVLLTQGKRLGEKETDDLIEEIRSDVERLNGVFDNLLALSRIGSNQEVETEPCSVRPFMSDLLTRMARQLQGTEVHTAIAADLPHVSAVPTYFEQIVRNLILNAQKYGGANSTIEVCAWLSEAHTVCLSVRDHGPGVSPAELESILDVFYRSPAAASHANGFGLGLPVSRRMAEAMGGALTARLPADGGLEMMLTLPEFAESLLEA